MFHTKFYRNLIINQDFKILGGEEGPQFSNIFQICLNFQLTLINLKMLHTKFHRNSITNEDFKILGVDEDPHLNFFSFSTNIQI